MEVKDVFDEFEKYAPVAISDEFCAKYKAYDNSGIILNCGNKVTGVLFTLDLTDKAIAEAERQGFNVIVTHHPAIFGGVYNLDLTFGGQAQNLARCIKSGISIISMHLNSDAAPQGIDYFLSKGLGCIGDIKIAAPLSCGGYGRAYSIERTSFKNFIQNIKKEFSTDRVFVYGDPNRQISRAASFCGAGCDEKNIAFAAENSADVFVSADIKHHEIVALLQRGISVVQLTHYASENYGFKKIYQKIKGGLTVGCSYFTDENLL